MEAKEGPDKRFLELKTVYETKYAEISSGEVIGYRESGNPPNSNFAKL